MTTGANNTKRKKPTQGIYIPLNFIYGFFVGAVIGGFETLASYIPLIFQ